MECIKYNKVDCETLENLLRSKVKLEKLENLSGKVQHTGMGGAEKSVYTNDRGERIFVLERSEYYAQDAYATDIWQFRSDFTADEAKTFVENFDKSQNKNEEIS